METVTPRQTYIAFFVICCFLFLVSCSRPTDLINVPTLVQRDELVVPKVSPVNQINFQWYVITSENVEQKIKDIQKDQGHSGTIVVYALTPDGYKDLSINVAELRRYIAQQNAVIDAYEKYYQKHPVPQQKPLETKAWWKLW